MIKLLVPLLVVVSLSSQPATPREKNVGIYYQPKPHDAEGLKRLIEGNPGGRQAFNLVLAPVVRADEGDRSVWRDYLQAIADHGQGRLRAVLDLHVLANEKWTSGSRLETLLNEILESPLSEHIAGWYVCDEPFARSRPDKDNPVDIARVADVVEILRRVLDQQESDQLVFVEYGSVFPLLKKGGDLINGGWNDGTIDPQEKAPFFYDGEWVTQGHDRPIRRRYGAFDEDVSMMNWWSSAELLERWMMRISQEIPLDQLMLVTGYDTTDRTPDLNAAWVDRMQTMIDLGERVGLAGYWFWAWQDIETGGRTYKGLSGWWENGDADDPHPLRYAALIESIP
jgi:hypothetical protein